jgi:DNA-binding CsgD family transcriptional regulator
MIAAQNLPGADHVLRVAVRSSDTFRRSAIAHLAVAAGHVVVEKPNDADVVVYLGRSEFEESEAHRAVVIGHAAGDAAAVLPQDASPVQIDAAIRAVAAGLTVRTAVPHVAGFGPAPEEKLEKLLTPRELEVLAAIGDGLGNKAIARRLDISLHTVKFHVEAILRKLDARSRAEAVAKGWSLFHEALDL